MQKAETIRFSPAAVSGCWLRQYDTYQIARIMLSLYRCLRVVFTTRFLLGKIDGGDNDQQGIAR